MTNVVMCGALLGALPLVETPQFLAALEAKLPEKHRHLLTPNREAVQRGLEIGRAYSVVRTRQEEGV